MSHRTSDRTYNVSDFVAAYLSFLTYKHLDNELGEYHRTRYVALKAAFAVDVEAPFSNDAPLERELLWDLFHGAVQHHVAASTPFDGISEAPRAVGELLVGHNSRLAKLRDATRAELLSMACALFVALYGKHADVHERDLLEHGFAGGKEPDPLDFW